MTSQNDLAHRPDGLLRRSGESRSILPQSASIGDECFEAGLYR